MTTAAPLDPDRRLRGSVAMYVFNDVTFDSRVRREAATLAGLGAQVTVVGVLRDRDASEPTRESVDGYEIVRVPVPGAWRRGWQSVVAPWSLRRRSIGALKRSVLDGPTGWPRAPRAAGALVLALGLSALRRIVLAASRGTRSSGSGEPVWPPDHLSWLVWWRWAVLGWARDAGAAAGRASVHHGHDLTALPAAVRAARRDGGQAVYDSHEIFVDSGLNAERPRWARALLRLLERRWARRTAALVTVNAAYAEVIAKRIRPRRTVVVHNCPPRWDLPEPPSSRLRDATGLGADTPIVLYHGAFSLHRGLAELAEAMLQPGLEGAHLVYLGYGGQRPLVDRLVADPRFGSRLHVVDAVAPDDLLEAISGADVDAIPLQHSTLNHWLCTPNKLFESLAAAVPVVVSDFPVMAGIVRDDPAGPLGEVCDPADAASIGAAIRRILDRPPADRAAVRSRCHEAAERRWNWETEAIGLVDLYAELLG